MTVRGAFSIDRIYRTEGVDWWANEELTYKEFNEVIDVYIKYKPKIVITHDCPHSVRKHLFGIDKKSITSNGLEGLFTQHQPEIWVFGHHHISKKEMINGTKFICLAELETLLI